jgi:two-component system phosphate regulon sensor histidine kinase PhoR
VRSFGGTDPGGWKERPRGEHALKAGKILSLCLMVVMAALAAVAFTAIESLPFVGGLSRVGHALIVAGTVALSIGVVLLPLSVIVDRSVSDLRRYIESSGSGGHAAEYEAPQWLRPIIHAFTGAVDRFRQREHELRNQLRDLEIRHHVSEAQRRQVEAVLNVLRDAVIVTDGFNEVVMANQAAAQLLGFDLQEAMHQPVDRLIRHSRLAQVIADVRENGNVNECRHLEFDFSEGEGDQDGPPVVYDVVFSCVENHKHEVGGVVTMLHDLTRERELAQMKTDFVSKASHELRTPLSSIRAYVEMLVDGEATDEESRREFYRIIHNETDRLGRLIDNMLNISRIEAGIVQIERENVDIKPLIDRAVNTIELQAREKNITVHPRVADVDLCVEGDADMLYQVFLNLMSNAVKYTPEGGRITVTADSDNLTRSVVASVSDTGLGIPPDALPRLFEKFFRVENYKRVAKGTGLGLSLCKHIVETVHHGQIGVESKLGMGSKFWFSIPMRYAGSRKAA